MRAAERSTPRPRTPEPQSPPQKPSQEESRDVLVRDGATALKDGQKAVGDTSHEVFLPATPMLLSRPTTPRLVSFKLA